MTNRQRAVLVWAAAALVWFGLLIATRPVAFFIWPALFALGWFGWLRRSAILLRTDEAHPVASPARERFVDRRWRSLPIGAWYFAAVGILILLLLALESPLPPANSNETGESSPATGTGTTATIANAELELAIDAPTYTEGRKAGITVRTNAVEARLNGHRRTRVTGGQVAFTVKLKLGTNKFTVTVSDNGGRRKSKTIEIFRDQTLEQAIENERAPYIASTEKVPFDDFAAAPMSYVGRDLQFTGTVTATQYDSVPKVVLLKVASDSPGSFIYVTFLDDYGPEIEVGDTITVYGNVLSEVPVEVGGNVYSVPEFGLRYYE